jgi:hypothetical protein
MNIFTPIVYGERRLDWQARLSTGYANEITNSRWFGVEKQTNSSWFGVKKKIMTVVYFILYIYIYIYFFSSKNTSIDLRLIQEIMKLRRIRPETCGNLRCSIFWITNLWKSLFPLLSFRRWPLGQRLVNVSQGRRKPLQSNAWNIGSASKRRQHCFAWPRRSGGRVRTGRTQFFFSFSPTFFLYIYYSSLRECGDQWKLEYLRQ